MKRLMKWWIKRGPGSVGSVAKVMAASYTQLRAKFPEASHEELMAGALARRNGISWMPGNVSELDQELMLATANGRFSVLIESIARRENPAAFRNISSEMRSLVRNVIDEVLTENIEGFDPYKM